MNFKNYIVYETLLLSSWGRPCMISQNLVALRKPVFFTYPSTRQFFHLDVLHKTFQGTALLEYLCFCATLYIRQLLEKLMVVI